MKLRIIKPYINAIENSWGYEYDFSDTVEIDLEDWEDYLSTSFGDKKRPGPGDVRANLELFINSMVAANEDKFGE
jgi:hypothetical protein